MNSVDLAAMDLNLLKIFEALYEEGGASRAAIRLDLTQSAVSAALRRLRTLYSDGLFVRTGRGLEPTSRASELRPVIAEALDKCRQSLSMSAPDATDFHGRTVAIALSDDFELAFGRRLMDLVSVLAPGLRLIFRQTHSQIVSTALANRETDIALTAGGLAARGLSREVLGEGTYACLLDGASLAKPNDSLTLDDYVARDHLLVSSGGIVGIVDEGLAAVSLKRRVIASTTHFAALPHLLKGSNAIATIPAHAARAIATVSGLRVIDCPLHLPRYPIELGWRTNVLRDPAVVKVRLAITQCFNATSNARLLA